jgi:hypothetical protein
LRVPYELVKRKDSMKMEIQIKRFELQLMINSIANLLKKTMTTKKPKDTKSSTIGILGWENWKQVTAQLEQMLGNICHVHSIFQFFIKGVKAPITETVTLIKSTE